MPWYRKLHWQIIIGLVAGTIYGIVAAASGWAQFTADWIAPFGTIFMNLLKLIAVPLVLGSLVSRVLFPTAAVGFALVAETEGWGLLNHLELPFALAVVLSVILLDLAIYLQHLVFHSDEIVVQVFGVVSSSYYPLLCSRSIFVCTCTFD